MTTERPWHARAREMRANGATYMSIAAALDLSEVTICRFFNPDYKLRQMQLANERVKRAMQTDPAFAARRRAADAASAVKRRKRRRAYEVAAAAGVPVEQVWAEWGVA
jgi:hypothetical protein